MSIRAARRAILAIVIVAALTIAGLVVPAGAAEAAPRSPWDAIAQCESGGNWSIDTGNGYYGGLQFSASTWRAHGGRGSAAAATRAEQIEIGRRVVASQGWEAWAGCAARLGLRGHDLSSDRAASAKRIAPCTARTLRARYVSRGPVAGARYADLELVNTGAHRCRLTGASRMIRTVAARDDGRVGAFSAAAFTPARHTGTRSKHPRLVLRAHGGHAFSRVPIRTATRHGDRCRRAGVAVLRSRPETTGTAIDGVRLRTCAKSRYKVLALERPGSSGSTARR